jgi:hypothetical protein
VVQPPIAYNLLINFLCGIHSLVICFLVKVVWDVEIVTRSTISMEVVMSTEIVGYLFVYSVVIDIFFELKMF